jgi:transposase-like protein
MNPTERDGSGAKTRRKFDETYKRHAAELTWRGDRTIKEVAAELGVKEDALYRWRKQYAPRPEGVGRARTLEESEAENRQLRAELVRMRERELALKKSLGILSETPPSGMPKWRR